MRFPSMRSDRADLEVLAQERDDRRDVARLEGPGELLDELPFGG